MWIDPTKFSIVATNPYTPADRGVQKHGLEFFSFSKRAFTELHRLVIVMHCCHLGYKVRIENLGRQMVSNSVAVTQ